jgi:hypothetical protein
MVSCVPAASYRTTRTFTADTPSRIQVVINLRTTLCIQPVAADFAGALGTYATLARE